MNIPRTTFGTVTSGFVKDESFYIDYKIVQFQSKQADGHKLFQKNENKPDILLILNILYAK